MAGLILLQQFRFERNLTRVNEMGIGAKASSGLISLNSLRVTAPARCRFYLVLEAVASGIIRLKNLTTILTTLTTILMTQKEQLSTLISNQESKKKPIITGFLSNYRLFLLVNVKTVRLALLPYSA